jgi:hypothetical protein
MTQSFRMPVLGPLTSAIFPTVGKYDPTPVEPVDWKLKISLKSNQQIQLQAVCDGKISTVPPKEVLGSEFVTVGLEGAARPTVARYYLEPHPVIQRLLAGKMANLHIGETVKWFLYELVDTTTLASIIDDQISSTRWQQQWEHSHYLPPEEADNAFLLGQISFSARKGEIIGTAPLDTNNLYDIQFGVYTTFGYVDPVHFFNNIHDLVEGDEQSNSAALDALIGTDWPFAARDDNVNTLITEAGQKLYPNAVLQEARQRLPWEVELRWREIADAQKALYLQRIYDHNLTLGTNPIPVFQFNTDEMVNSFQLEAVVEFFLYWKDPGVSGTPPPIIDVTTLREVNFGSAYSIELVLIDAFNDDRLGNPALPKPDWIVDPWVQDGNKCSADGPTSPYSQDEYNGVLFLLYQGQIKGWYRWNSYSSHRWEDDSQGGTDKCIMASSIQGNLEYQFWSRTSPSRAAINHGLCVFYPGDDPDILAMRPANVQRDLWVPGIFYFRGGTPVDPDGKTAVIFHFGLTKHDQASPTAEKTHHQYNGSGGCIASPSYYPFRWDLSHWYFQQNPTLDPDKKRLLQKIQNIKFHAEAERLYESLEKQALSNAWGSDVTKANGYTIHGTFWLIHPDEPTQK